MKALTKEQLLDRVNSGPAGCVILLMVQDVLEAADNPNTSMHLSHLRDDWTLVKLEFCAACGVAMSPEPQGLVCSAEQLIAEIFCDHCIINMEDPDADSESESESESESVTIPVHVN